MDHSFFGRFHASKKVVLHHWHQPHTDGCADPLSTVGLPIGRHFFKKCEVTLQGTITYPLLICLGTRPVWWDMLVSWSNPQSLQLEILRLSSSWRTLALPVRQSESSARGDASGTCTVHVGIGGCVGGGGWCCDTRVEDCEMLGCVKATLKEGNIINYTTQQERRSLESFFLGFSFLKYIMI